MEKTEKERIIFKLQTGISNNCSDGWKRNNWLDYSWEDLLQKSLFEGVEQPKNPPRFYLEKISREIAKDTVWSGGFFPGMLSDRTFIRMFENLMEGGARKMAYLAEKILPILYKYFGENISEIREIENNVGNTLWHIEVLIDGRITARACELARKITKYLAGNTYYEVWVNGEMIDSGISSLHICDSDHVPLP